MLETVEQVRGWLDRAAGRHYETGQGECSCGWTTNGPEMIPWAEHADVALVSDLAECLPARSAMGVSCAQIESDLYDCIDRLREYNDAMLDALLRIACGHPQSAQFAAAVVCRMLPGSAWAEAIRTDGIQFDATLAEGFPAGD